MESLVITLHLCSYVVEAHLCRIPWLVHRAKLVACGQQQGGGMG